MSKEKPMPQAAPAPTTCLVDSPNCTGALVRWQRPIVSTSRHPVDVALSAIGLGIEAREVVRRIKGLTP